MIIIKKKKKEPDKQQQYDASKVNARFDLDAMTTGKVQTYH